MGKETRVVSEVGQVLGSGHLLGGGASGLTACETALLWDEVKCTCWKSQPLETVEGRPVGSSRLPPGLLQLPSVTEG